MTFPVRRPLSSTRRLQQLLLAGLSALMLTSLTQAQADTMVLGNSLAVTFTALGTGTIMSAPTLAYTTAGPVSTPGATRRAVTVRLSEPLPPGVTIIVSFAPDSGNGTSAGSVTLSTEPQVLVDLIDAEVTQAAKAIQYAVYSSKGFVTTSLNVEYKLIDR